MKVTDTISVNPSKATLGHVETASTSIFRSPVLDAKASSSSIELTRILFPSCGTGVNEYKKYAVPLRTLFATILIVTGLTLLTSTVAVHSVAFAICTLCFGGCLALGFFTRPIMLGAAVFYCISGALALRGGAVDMTVFSLMFGCLIFGVIGAGKYSCDTLLRHALLSHKKSAERKRKENMMGYKAFHSVKL